MMSNKKNYFSSYKSPNIVIVPTSIENIPPLKRTKIMNDISESTQIFKKNNNTVTEANHTQTMSVQRNVTKKKHLNNKNVPLIDSEHDGNQKVEEIPKKINKCDLKIENKVNSNLKSKIKHSNSFKITQNHIKDEMLMDSCVNKCEATLPEPRSLKRSINKGSENFTITSRIIKEPLQKSETCLVKHKFCTNMTNLTDNEKIKNKTNVKFSNKNSETDKYSEQSSQNQNENKQKFKSSKSKMLKSDIQVEDMDEKNNSHFKNETIIEANIHKNTIGNSNVNLKLKSKKSDLSCQTKTKVDKHDKIKTKSRKIIKIVINVTYNNLHEKKNTKIMRESEHDKNPDLSFLDDFDVDEVVESLFSCKKTKENTLNIKENINKRIQIKGNIGNVLKNSSTFFAKQKIKTEAKKLKLPKITSKATENNLKLNKHEVQHISGDIDVENLCRVSHVNNISLEKVVNKIKANDHKNYKKTKKILPLKTNNVTETNLNSKESELLDTKPVKNQLIVCNNTVHTKESSKDFSGSDNNNVTAKEEKNVMNAINIQTEKITNECSPIIQNDYHTDDLLSRKLEIKICDLLTEKYSINTVAHCGKFSKIFKCTNMVTRKIFAVKMLNKCDYYKGKRKIDILQKIQQEIPKENLSCIFLMSSFILDYHWCFMTHYYFTNLQQVLQNERKYFHIDEIRNLSMQLVLALFVVRNKNIVHSDIRPSHILLNREMKELKLCGFDEAYYYNNSIYPSANIGTVNYRAPEIILGYSNGFSIDIWSTALVMYEMVTSDKLFSGESNNEILYKQISIFGNFPCSMLMQSRFNKDHFVGTNFVRNMYCNKEKHSINSFGNDGGIQKMIMDAYEKHWGKIDTNNEIFKLNLLCQLLEKMFILEPKHRLPVEYVYASPFFSAK